MAEGARKSTCDAVHAPCAAVQRFRSVFVYVASAAGEDAAEEAAAALARTSAQAASPWLAAAARTRWPCIQRRMRKDSEGGCLLNKPGASDSSFAFASMSNPFASAALKLDSKPDVIEAAKSGNIELVKDQVVADAGCVLEADCRHVCQLLARFAAAHDF